MYTKLVSFNITNVVIFCRSDTLSVTLSQNVVVNTNIGICLKMEKIRTNLYKLTHLTSKSINSGRGFQKVKCVFASCIHEPKETKVVS